MSEANHCGTSLTWLEPIGARIVPANFGPMRGGNAHARIEGTCGDTMEFWLDMEGEKIHHASYTTDGCETSAACGGMAAHMSEGRTLAEMKQVRPIEVLEALGQPDNEEAHHCADLALRTLAKALDAYARTLEPGPTAEARCHPVPCEDAHLEDEGSAGAGRIRRRILVLSGKGGVGKTTVAVNLALGLAAEGIRAGLLDVDIHGPSVPRLMGLEGDVPRVAGPVLLPVERDGLKVMSMGFVLDPDQAAVWRGPKKAGVVQQLVQQVQWGELDVLVVDCPPGTGDEHLSIHQALGRVDGAVLVTTPQELAVLDARKAAGFCRMVGIPILGVVENMGGFTCPSCGTLTPIFHAEGGRRMADDLGAPFLGSLPLDPELGKRPAGSNLEGLRKAFRGVLEPLLAQLEAASR